MIERRSILAALAWGAAATAQVQPVLGTRSAPIVVQDGLRFRDLDRNGRLDPYEDWRLSPERRADDLVGRMTLREKAGSMMHGSLPGLDPGPGAATGASTDGYDLPAVERLVAGDAVTSFITRLAVPPVRLAEQNNAVQAIAERGRLGIPLTVSTDPRHHFQFVPGASVVAGGFTQWPETLGFAALRDPARVRRFAEVARAEYRAVGIHQALSPQADLATEPRWSRMTGTFGADPALARDMVGAYVAGFQGGPHGLAPDGVLAVVKHWVGYGAEPDGLDGHNRYGRVARIGDAALARHIVPFLGAFDAGVAGVMPTYVILSDVTVDGRRIEPVGAGFSRELLTGLLRGRYGYKGIILSDWAITNDCDAGCRDPQAPQRVSSIAMPWGVERLARADRFVKGVEAGLDQFGGVTETDLLVRAVHDGRLLEARLAESARRVLVPKFRMGLFENPYVDAARAAAVVGAAAGEAARTQAEAQVLLRNAHGLLPLRAGARVFLRGVAPAAARAYGLVPVDDPAAAEVALIRTQTPFETLHPNHFFGSRQHEGRLDFRAGDPDFEGVKRAAAHVPVVLSIILDRPAVLTALQGETSAILANFGAGDAAVLDVVTGRAVARGRLPFELPSSMAAVVAQDPALPDDSRAPLYPFGAGLIAPSRGPPLVRR